MVRRFRDLRNRAPQDQPCSPENTVQQSVPKARHCVLGHRLVDSLRSGLQWQERRCGVPKESMGPCHWILGSDALDGSRARTLAS